ncbi:hypothetical protein ACTHQ6_07740 [Arthrobacter sp. SAFR-179]
MTNKVFGCAFVLRAVALRHPLGDAAVVLLATVSGTFRRPRFQ